MFIEVATQTYPLSYDDIKKRQPRYSLSDTIDHQFLAQLGYAPVETAPYPANLKANEYAELSAPTLVNGKWIRQYVIRTYPFTGQTDDSGNPISVEQAKANFAARVKERLRSELAVRRYRAEVSGITMPNGVQIKTDRESQATITGAYASTLLNPGTVINWKGANGWVQINATEIATIAGAVSAHVQSCFNKERQLSDKLDTLTPEQVFEFDVDAEWNAI